MEQNAIEVKVKNFQTKAPYESLFVNFPTSTSQPENFCWDPKSRSVLVKRFQIEWGSKNGYQKTVQLPCKSDVEKFWLKFVLKENMKARKREGSQSLIEDSNLVREVWVKVTERNLVDFDKEAVENTIPESEHNFCQSCGESLVLCSSEKIFNNKFHKTCYYRINPQKVSLFSSYKV